MPNWINNELCIRGNKREDIDNFVKKYFTENNFDFNKIIPEPSSKEDCPKEYICDCKERCIEDTRGGNWFNWYDFRCDKWGTKWNACETRSEASEDGLTLDIYFSTAWTAPLPIFRELKKQNPNLRITFDYFY